MQKKINENILRNVGTIVFTYLESFGQKWKSLQLYRGNLGHCRETLN